MRASVAALVASLAVLVVYWPVLALGYVWDDFALYLEVPALRDASSWWTGTLVTVHHDLHYFRPVALLTFKAQFLLFGPSPVAAHAVGLVLHVGNVFLLALLAGGIAGGSASRAALAGLLYGLHPVLIEPVSWMSCRFDLLVTFWLLLALHADLRVRAPAARAAVVGALYFLALNSKEMAAPFPAVLMLFQLATRYYEHSWRDILRVGLRGEATTYLLMVIALVAYAALRARFIGDTVDVDADIVAELTGLPERAAFVAATMLFHLRNVLAPFAALSPLHPVDLDSLRFTAVDVLALLAVTVLLAVLAWGVLRRQRSVVLAAAGLLALAPVLQIVPLSIARNIGHERYLTFPLVLFVLAAATAPWPAGRWARVARVTASLVGVAWLMASVANIRLTVPLWRSDVTLWTWALARTGSDYARHSLVAALLNEGRPDLAARYLPVEPSSAYRAHTRFVLAKFLLGRGQRDSGEAQLRLALREFPPWHATPPAGGRALREFEQFRGQAGSAYATLAELEFEAGRLEAAHAAALIAQFYYPGYEAAVRVQALAEERAASR